MLSSLKTINYIANSEVTNWMLPHSVLLKSDTVLFPPSVPEVSQETFTLVSPA